MEQKKLENNKETLQFLNQKYPKCFFLQGKARPLKIGIFQDLVKDLSESEIVSNRLLRTCLRHYTSSWRYLSSIKAGAARIDLQGQEGEIVEQDHAEHASAQLKESKLKAAKLKEAKSQTNSGANDSSATNSDKTNSIKKNSAANGVKFHSKKTTEHKKPRKFDQNKSQNGKAQKKQAKPKQHSAVQTRAVENSELEIGKQLLVKLGKEPMPVEIIDIAKDGISVQLKSGMTVKVQVSQLYSQVKAAE